MTEFHHMFYTLPVNVQYHILDELEKALLWRGWDKLRHKEFQSNAEKHVNNIADILHAEGHDIMEYT